MKQLETKRSSIQACNLLYNLQGAKTFEAARNQKRSTQTVKLLYNFHGTKSFEAAPNQKCTAQIFNMRGKPHGANSASLSNITLDKTPFATQSFEDVLLRKKIDFWVLSRNNFDPKITKFRMFKYGHKS